MPMDASFLLLINIGRFTTLLQNGNLDEQQQTTVRLLLAEFLCQGHDLEGWAELSNDLSPESRFPPVTPPRAPISRSALAAIPPAELSLCAYAEEVRPLFASLWRLAWRGPKGPAPYASG
jgi:hypothetical protein